MSVSAQDNYRPAVALAICASILFVVQALVATLAAFSTSHQIALVDAARFGSPILPGLAEAQDVQQRLLAAIEFGIGLGAAIFFLIWVYRASRNARSLGIEGMQYSPGWSVGWFLVPLANLFMPYMVVRELWKASAASPMREWRQAVASPIVGVWWAVSVVSMTLHYSPIRVLSGQMELTDSSRFGTGWLDALREFYCGRLIFDIVEIAVSVLTMVVVVCITDFQEGQRVALNELRTRQVAPDSDRPNMA